ncbi:DNA mismatch repair endonuclease MutL [Desulfuribacillus alkaliarsenatis]|uniref:DNA mismatch repair protein MutL n=1 Tax=Desulfuribacillus alkaliarsenatis TaxID=766136 RepID=A0A1E5G0M4_9FIRM|nr:DNA mismatch repair endonuclease MutL [Desulfuribacillus alkaliarsenatis]OEF96008.1 hypothetical protein BHF68_09685 [Desulfuribacillus alkaliarsenatis]
MQTIRILDEHIANQIAAGEVVERPVSVIKELVENAIDANSTRIVVEIQQGGLDKIKVTDNGTGMSKEDTLLAFERHATSKVLNEKSLFKIKTLGFRGEALPSISAISKLEIKTRQHAASLGNYLRIEGGKKGTIEPIGCPIGTQIVVEELFYNTPARLKYLKTISTEANHINDYLMKMSMAYPNISFNYSHNNKQIFMTQGNNSLHDVLINIYGSNTRDYWIPIALENLDFKIEGYIAKPEFTRSNRQHISFFVNGRFIRNPKLSEAIVKAYHTLTPINKYPITCLHITMDYSLVDVNVHPAKLEVRFSKEQELNLLLQESINRELLRINLVPEISAKETVNNTPKVNNISKVDNIYNNYSERDTKKVLAVHEPFKEDSYTNLSNSHTNTSKQSVIEFDNNEHDFRIIGQVHGTYIIAEDDKGMLLIDQHAAHERINYEKALNAVKNQTIRKVELLVPIQLHYSKTEIELIKEHKEILEQFALDFDQFGEKTLIIRAYPDWIPNNKVYEYVTFVIDKALAHTNKINIIEILEESCILFACKSSIKANQRLSVTEMERLIIDLRKTSSPYTCPHGRPISVHYSTYEIEKLFKRKN